MWIVGEKSINADFSEVLRQAGRSVVVDGVDEDGNSVGFEVLDQDSPKHSRRTFSTISGRLGTQDLGRDVDRIGADEIGCIVVGAVQGSQCQNAQGMFTTRTIRQCNVGVIKRGNQDPRRRFGLLDDFEHAFNETRGSLGERLDLHVHQPIVLLRQGECLGQCGDDHPAGTVMFDPRRVEPVERAERMGGAWTAVLGNEPGAGVEGMDLVEVEVRDAKTVLAAGVAREPPGHISRPHQRFIVEDERDAVPGQLDVELPRTGTGFPGKAGGLQRIFRCAERIAPMCNDRGMISVSLQVSQEVILRVAYRRFSPIDRRAETPAPLTPTG